MPLNRQAVKKIMISKGITNAELAEKLGITTSGVSNLLNREVPTSRIKTISQLAKALDVEPLEIVKGE